jgi:Glycogen recognition site of AMP-activated protein kinase
LIREPEDLLAALGRERVAVPPGVREAVMTRVRAAARSPRRRLWRWATAPRLSPLAGAAALAAIVAVVALAPWRHPPGPGQGAVPTRFVFLAPRAERVAITGDWIHWDPVGIPLESPRGDGVWVAEIRVPPGLHHYVFVVDGTDWRPDPNAAAQVDDGFGRRNSVLLVPARQVS